MHTKNIARRCMQGIFVRYFVTEDDNADGERVGGYGSTDR